MVFQTCRIYCVIKDCSVRFSYLCIAISIFCHEKMLVNIAELFSTKTIKHIVLNSQKEVAYSISWAVGKEAMDTPEYSTYSSQKEY